MTAPMFLTSITNAIAALSISGVTIKDVDEVAAAWTSTPKVLYPNLFEDFVTGHRVEYPTFVQDGTGPVNIFYNLNYRYLSTQVGDLATAPVQGYGLLTQTIAIADALVSVRAPYDGRVLMTYKIDSIGAKTDPVGNQYFGADIELSIQEIHN
jgi:hypothetical protein